MHELFYWLFNMSITASLSGLVVLLLRRWKKIPRRIAVFLWLAPFVRMCLPFGLDSPYSLMSLLRGITTKTIVVYRPAEEMTFSMMNTVMAANAYFPITYKVQLLEKVFQAAGIVWLIGFLAIGLTLGILYFATLRELRDASHWWENIYFSWKITTPAVYGILRPRIVLPERYRAICGERTAENLPAGVCEYVLLHEQTHMKCRDNLWRVLAFGLAAVHWFNPFAWIFLKQFLGDVEMACDERVLAKLSAAQAKEYAHSLLDCRESANVFVSAFGGAAIRTRIENIVSFRKLTWVSLVGFGVLLLAILGILLTNGG